VVKEISPAWRLPTGTWGEYKIYDRTAAALKEIKRLLSSDVRVTLSLLPQLLLFVYIPRVPTQEASPD